MTLLAVLNDAAIIGAGNPTNVVTPPYAGALYRDIVGHALYMATGIEPADWVATGGGGGGGTLQEVLSAGNDAAGQGITGLLDPVDAQDAATKAYVDGAIPATPGLTDVLEVSNSAGMLGIADVSDPTADQDAATKKYVDDNSVLPNAALPVANTSTGTTLDTTTYEDTWAGDASKMRVMVFDTTVDGGSVSATAWAINGDVGPRLLITSDGTIIGADGTIDPVDGSADIAFLGNNTDPSPLPGSPAATYIAMRNVEIQGPCLIASPNLQVNAQTVFTSDTINMAFLPNADPHVNGQLWTNAGVLTVSTG